MELMFLNGSHIIRGKKVNHQKRHVKFLDTTKSPKLAEISIFPLYSSLMWSLVIRSLKPFP